MFTALLDTCVLWPSRQRDFLLSLAAEHAYRPIWSSAILDELQRTEREKLIGVELPEEEADARAAHLVAQMRSAFFGSEVEGWEAVTPYGLPDPDDEHVLAAAVVGGAESVVTWNVKDFPVRVVPTGIRVVLPADFAGDMVAADVGKGLRAVESMAARSGWAGPKQTVQEILDYLADKYDMIEAVDLLRAVGDNSATDE